MPTFIVQATHRDTGQQQAFDIPAATAQEAINAASDRGYVVSQVLPMPDVGDDDHRRPRPQRPHAAADAFPKAGGMAAMGLALIMLGLLVLYCGWTATTTVDSGGSPLFGERTHNLGLLFRQLVLVTTGSAFMLAGFVLRAGAAILRGMAVLASR